MSKFFQIIVVLLLANSSVLGQDTIERVYAPKHLYLPLSFGFSKQLSLGTLYAGEIRKYLDQNPASDCFKTARFTANYTLFRRGKHALDFGLNLETKGF